MYIWTKQVILCRVASAVVALEGIFLGNNHSNRKAQCLVRMDMGLWTILIAVATPVPASQHKQTNKQHTLKRSKQQVYFLPNHAIQSNSESDRYYYVDQSIFVCDLFFCNLPPCCIYICFSSLLTKHCVIMYICSEQGCCLLILIPGSMKIMTLTSSIISMMEWDNYLESGEPPSCTLCGGKKI